MFRASYRRAMTISCIDSLFLKLVLFFILPLVTCPLRGQVVQKKQLEPADYHLWGELHLDKISPDDKWVSFKMMYKSKIDTLFLRSTSGTQTFGFAKAEQGTFINANFFICKAGSILHILNLENFRTEIISDVKYFKYDTLTDNLLYLTGSGLQKNTLVIRCLKTSCKNEIQNVSTFETNSRKGLVAVITNDENNYGAGFIDLKKEHTLKWIIKNETEPLKGLTWHKEGNAVAFIKQADSKGTDMLYLYLLNTSKLYTIHSAEDGSSTEKKSLIHDAHYSIMVADDLQKVFFFQSTLQTSNKDKKNEVEIWNANDKWVYPEQQIMGSFDKVPRLMQWYPLLNKIDEITSEDLPKFMLTGDQRHVILSNPKDYEPQMEMEGPRNFYIMNLQTMEKKIFLKKHPYNPLALNPSPSGKYFAYFKEGDWWIYDIRKNTHLNITAQTGVKFSFRQKSNTLETVCGNPGWTVDDKQILLYDQYDLWAIASDGSSFKRLTNGRKDQVNFRIVNETGKKTTQYVYGTPSGQCYNLNEDLILRAKGQDGKTGYLRWNKNSEIKIIIYRDSYFDEINFNESKKCFFLREQKFDISPRLLSTDGIAKEKNLYSSNPQQQNYFWGKSELIEYTNSKGDILNGVLFYPGDYDPQKKYPMVVSIYEILSHRLHNYSIPSYENENGFNTALLTTQGYFVLFPDLRLEYQSPGISAADCVISATRNIIQRGIIDADRIGLTAHSFGGYECAFIITQTNLFAAAIASGAITDLISYYHTLNQASGKPNMWRIQSDQWDMGQPPYEIPSVYQANSPIANVQNIKTPVLLWAGKNDLAVDNRQSVEFYLALRQLRKKSIMLLYPNQGHLITNPTYQIDLTRRTVQWFNYFLKQDHSADWITNGIQ